MLESFELVKKCEESIILHISTQIKTKNLISTAEITVLQIPNQWKPGKRTLWEHWWN